MQATNASSSEARLSKTVGRSFYSRPMSDVTCESAISYGFASPTIASLISKRTERALEGEALGINQSASSMARILGPLAGGLAYAALGASAPYVGGAIVALMAIILARGIEQSVG